MDAKQHRKELVQEYKQRKLTGGVFCIVNDLTGQRLLLAETDLQGSRNRFDFMTMTGNSPHYKLNKDYAAQKGKGFRFEVLEQIEQKENQDKAEFLEELEVLRQLWCEKYLPEALY